MINKEDIKNLEEQKRIDEVRVLVTDFLESKLSDNNLAKKYHMSPATVGRRLTDKPRILQVFADKGNEIYEYIINYRKSKALEEERKITDEIKLLVHLFLKTNKQDIDLAEITNIPSTTVGRRLTDEERIKSIFGEEVFKDIHQRRQENLKNAKIRGGINSNINNIYLKNRFGKFEGSTKLKLDIFKDEIDEIELLGHLILTFRVKLDSIINLFSFSEATLTSLYKIFGDNAINYLLYNDNTNQNIAIEELISFYQKLVNNKNNKEELTRLLNRINDNNIKELLKEKKIDNNIEEIINFQIKYSLNSNYIANLFNISLEQYELLTKSIRENDIILNKKYDDLMNYYNRVDKGVRNV